MTDGAKRVLLEWFQILTAKVRHRLFVSVLLRNSSLPFSTLTMQNTLDIMANNTLC